MASKQTAVDEDGTTSEDRKHMVESLDAISRSIESQGLLIAETARRTSRLEETQQTQGRELNDMRVSVARIETKVDEALGNGLAGKVREIAHDLREWKNAELGHTQMQWSAILKIALAIFSLGVVSTAVIALVQWLSS